MISQPTTLAAFRDVLRGFAIQNVKVDQESTLRARDEAREAQGVGTQVSIHARPNEGARLRPRKFWRHLPF